MDDTGRMKGQTATAAPLAAANAAHHWQIFCDLQTCKMEGMSQHITAGFSLQTSQSQIESVVVELSASQCVVRIGRCSPKSS